MSTAIYFEDSDFITLKAADFNQIKRAADQSPLKRARYCLHRDVQDKIHEMIIAMRDDTYVHPHRHLDKSESFHLIEGEALVLFFNDAGEVTRRVRLGETRSGLPFYCRINCSWWHTVVPLTPYVVVHETTGGPFDPQGGQLADWAPSVNETEAVSHYRNKLCEL